MEDEKRRLLGKDSTVRASFSIQCLFLTSYYLQYEKNLSYYAQAKIFIQSKMTPDSIRVAIYFTLLVAFGIANSISGRWNQMKFGNNYAFFNNQVLNIF